MEETVGPVEETTSRVMAADRPYGEFYDFYSVSPEYFGSSSYFLEYSIVCKMQRTSHRHSLVD
jgi:hypothetical protein